MREEKGKYYFLIRNKKSRTLNEVRYDFLNKDISCTCWWFANRTVTKKHKDCSHIKTVKNNLKEITG